MGLSWYGDMFRNFSSFVDPDKAWEKVNQKIWGGTSPLDAANEAMRPGRMARERALRAVQPRTPFNWKNMLGGVESDSMFKRVGKTGLKGAGWGGAIAGAYPFLTAGGEKLLQSLPETLKTWLTGIGPGHGRPELVPGHKVGSPIAVPDKPSSGGYDIALSPEEREVLFGAKGGGAPTAPTESKSGIAEGLDLILRKLGMKPPADGSGYEIIKGTTRGYAPYGEDPLHMLAGPEATNKFLEETIKGIHDTDKIKIYTQAEREKSAREQDLHPMMKQIQQEMLKDVQRQNRGAIVLGGTPPPMASSRIAAPQVRVHGTEAFDEANRLSQEEFIPDEANLTPEQRRILTGLRRKIQRRGLGGE